jgi:rubrerythrin
MYTRLGSRVREAAVQQEMAHLVSFEKEHQAMLEKYRHGELPDILYMEQAVDYKIAETLDAPEAAPDMTLKGLFLLAARQEKASHDFYVKMAGLHGKGTARTMFERLAGMEQQHKGIVERLLTEVAFPQTDGG